MHSRPIRSPQADFFFWLTHKLDDGLDWLLDRIRARLGRRRAPANSPTSTVRCWSDEDRALIERLQKKTGIRSVTDLLRKALRDSAEKEEI